MEEAEPTKESGDPKRFSWLECEPHPLPQLWKGRGAVPSRGDVIEAKIADASGRAAEKVILEALEVEPAQEAGIFARVVCLGVVDPELGNNAFQVPEVCHVDKILKVIDDEQRARTRDDRPPDLGGMSLAEVGLALKSHLLAPGASQQRRR